MLKKIICFAFLLSLFSAMSSKANWGQGYYNPAFNPSLAMSPFNPLWGGGYNLNSMFGNGGWGGFPAGYGTMMPPMAAPNAALASPAAPCVGGGVMTGGFGGYYSPFIGGY